MPASKGRFVNDNGACEAMRQSRNDDGRKWVKKFEMPVLLTLFGLETSRVIFRASSQATHSLNQALRVHHLLAAPLGDPRSLQQQPQSHW